MPHIIVHDLTQAIAALRAAAERDMPVTLQSPPGALRYLGTPYFLAIAATAHAEVPAARCEMVLDCDALPGLALDAMRRGARRIRLSASAEVLARVRDIAAQTGASIESMPAGDDAFDLAGHHDPLAAARRFLAGTSV